MPGRRGPNKGQIVPPDIIEQLQKTLRFLESHYDRDRYPESGEALTLILNNQAAIMVELSRLRRILFETRQK